MLEHLGLGITLFMEDQFTPKSNEALNSFDKLQDGAENLVNNIQRYMLNMRNVMMTGFTFREMGQEVENFGMRVNKTFEKMYEGTVKAGAHWETLKNTLTTFYNTQTDATMMKGLDLASKTPFEVDDVMDSLRSLKAVKIDALKEYDELDKAGKKYKKTFLEYVGDLGAFNPQQGMQGAMYAMRNLIGGNKKSLDMRFDVNSEYVLGEKWSSDPTKVQEQFKTFVNKLAPNMMKNLEGTFDQLVSNMHDKWTMFKIAVAEGGAFDGVKSTLVYISNKFDKMYDDGRMKKFAVGIGQALKAVWKPIDLILRGLTDLTEKFAKFSELHPTLAKIALGTMAVAGGFLTVTGAILKMSGGILLALSSISMLILNFKLMKATGFGVTTAFNGMGKVLFGAVKGLSVIGLLGAGMFLAWENNIGGLKDKVNGFFGSMNRQVQMSKLLLSGKSYEEAYARVYMSQGKVLEGQKKVEFALNKKLSLPKYDFKTVINIPPLVKVFSGKFLKVIAISKAFWQVITGHFDGGVMYFSKKDWNLYKETGIEGLVQGMVYARDKIDHFFKGLKDGLTIVYSLMAEFVEIVWKPIKVVLDTVSEYAKKHPNGLIGKLFLGKDGVGVSVADKRIEQAEKLGKVAGTVLGTLLAFKGMNALTSIISKPFKNLYKVLGKTQDKARDLKKSLTNLKIGGLTGLVKDPKWNNYFRDVKKDMKDYVAGYDKTSKYQKGVAYRDGKYQNLRPQDIDSTYYNYMLKDKLNEGSQVQVKRRGRLGKLLFGEQYYAKEMDGTRRKLGKFGGLFHLQRDESNIENRVSSLYGSRVSPRENTVEWLTHRPNIGDPIGKLGNLKGAREALGGVAQTTQDSLRSIVRSITGLSNSQFNRFASVRQKALGADLMKLNNQAQRGNFDSVQDALRYKEYSRLGMDVNNLGASERLLHGSRSGQLVLGQLRGGRASDLVNNSEDYQRIKRQARSSSLNQNVYADTKQGSLSRLLFGQKMYTVQEGEDENYTKSKVGRRGGIFRSEAKDNQYAPAKVTRMSRAMDWTKGVISKPIGKIRDSASNLAGRFTMPSAVTSTRDFVGSRFGKIGSWYNTQRERVGLAPRVPKEGSMGFKGAMAGTGRFLFGSKIRDAGGAVIGKRQGFIPKVGKGLLGTGKGLVRGAGALGGLAFRAMPYMAMGSMAFGSIKAKGAGANAQEKKGLGLKANASDFQVGLKRIQKDIGKVDFTKMYKNMKSGGSSAFSTIKEIAKTSFEGLKKILPQILSDSFNGIKGLASIAWTWIKTDGVKLFGELGTDAMGLLGKAMEWVGENGGKILGKIAEYAIGTLLPKLIEGVIKLGIFIIEHIPTVLKGLVGIALNILGGILEGVKEIFKGIGNFLWESISGAFSGLGTILLKALAIPIRAIPVVGNQVADYMGLPKHHGGLWMSPDEHTAVIKKDETVLPPDKSKRLNDLIGDSTPRRQAGIARTPTKVDNSIKIDKVEIVVKSDKLSRSEAREQALMIVDELKKIKREKQVRSYEEIDTAELLF